MSVRVQQAGDLVELVSGEGPLLRLVRRNHGPTVASGFLFPPGALWLCRWWAFGGALQLREDWVAAEALRLVRRL